MAPNIHTIHSASNPNPESRSLKDRYCPGMTRLWHFRPEAFDPRNRARDDAIRRWCMLITFGCHTALNVLALFWLAISFDVLGFLINAIIAVIFFGFLLWALPAIGDAEGERIVVGKTVTRWHFDIFLMFCAVMYAATLLGTVFGMGGIAGSMVGLVPMPLWILIWVVAWIASWDNTVSLA